MISSGRRSQPPPEAQRLERRIFTAVEAVRVRSGRAGIEDQLGSAVIACPALGGLQQAPPDTARSVQRIDGHLIEPGALTEAQRVQVQVDGAEADDVTVEIGDEGGASRGVTEPQQSF